MVKLHEKRKYERENARNYDDRVKYILLSILAFFFSIRVSLLNYFLLRQVVSMSCRQVILGK